MAQYKISEKAKEDLDNIWFYTYRKWSIEQADIRFKLILKQIEFVSKNQHLGKGYDTVIEGLKGSLIPPHIIFYIREDNGTILILRVLHQRMDLSKRI